MSQSLLLRRFRGQDRPCPTAHSAFAPHPSLPHRVLLARPTAFCQSNCHYWGWDTGHRAMLRFLFLLFGLIGLQTDSSGTCTTPSASPSLTCQACQLSSERLAISGKRLCCGRCNSVSTGPLPHCHLPQTTATFVRQGAFPHILGPWGEAGVGGGGGVRGEGRARRCHAWLEWMPHD